MINKRRTYALTLCMVYVTASLTGCDATLRIADTGSSGCCTSSSSGSDLILGFSLSVGSRISLNVLVDFVPRPTRGKKWIYETRNSATMSSVETSAEVVNVVNDQVTMQIRSESGKVIEKQSSSSTYAITDTTEVATQIPAQPELIYEGTEDITVPSGIYKSVKKMSYTSTTSTSSTKTISWVAQGIGAVKTETVTTNTTTHTSVTKTSVLKSYSS